MPKAKTKTTQNKKITTRKKKRAQSNIDIYDIAIVGGGAGGLSAGVYAGRYKVNTILFEGNKPGGYTATASVIENYPGVAAIDGYEIIKTMKEQNDSAGTVVNSEAVKNIEKVAEGLFHIETEKNTYKAKTIILAHGAKHRLLGLPKEEKLMGKGVAICAVCDAPLFKDKEVAIIGGGDSSVKSMPLLCEYAKHVYLITRNEDLRGEPVNLERLKTLKNYTHIPVNEVTAIVGKEKVEGVKLKHKFKNKKTLNVDGLFIMIGFEPITEYYKELGVSFDSRGYINVDKFMQTNVPGVYAAGDCTNGAGSFKQSIIAAAHGSMAATSAYEYMKKLGQPAPVSAAQTKIHSIGYWGSFLTAMCCLIKPSLLAFLSSIGIVLSVSDEMLLPFLFLFFTIFVLSTLSSFFAHGQIGPIVLSIFGVVALTISLFIIPIGVIAYLSILLLLFAAVWDMHEVKGCQNKCLMR